MTSNVFVIPGSAIGKSCTRCSKWKVLGDFYRHKAVCKECVVQQTKERRLKGGQPRRDAEHDFRITSDKLCECGCGEYTLLAFRSDTRDGTIKGEPHRFLRGHAKRKPPSLTTEAKTCTSCSEAKSLNDFPPDTRLLDGRGSWCRVCVGRAALAWLKTENGKSSKRSARSKYEAQKRDLFQENVSATKVFELAHGLCGICGLLVDFADAHLDHIVPLSRGGYHSYKNIRLAHSSCNITKGAHILMDVWDGRMGEPTGDFFEPTTDSTRT